VVCVRSTYTNLDPGVKRNQGSRAKAAKTQFFRTAQDEEKEVAMAKIYVVNDKYDADVIAYQVRSPWDADISVYEVDSEWDANEDFLWFFVNSSYDASIKLYWADDSWDATLKVCFVSDKWDAKWQTSNQWRGRL